MKKIKEKIIKIIVSSVIMFLNFIIKVRATVTPESNNDLNIFGHTDTAYGATATETNFSPFLYILAFLLIIILPISIVISLVKYIKNKSLISKERFIMSMFLTISLFILCIIIINYIIQY